MNTTKVSVSFASAVLLVGLLAPGAAALNVLNLVTIGEEESTRVEVPGAGLGVSVPVGLGGLAGVEARVSVLGAPIVNVDTAYSGESDLLPGVPGASGEDGDGSGSGNAGDASGASGDGGSQAAAGDGNGGDSSATGSTGVFSAVASPLGLTLLLLAVFLIGILAGSVSKGRQKEPRPKVERAAESRPEGSSPAPASGASR